MFPDISPRDYIDERECKRSTIVRIRSTIVKRLFQAGKRSCHGVGSTIVTFVLPFTARQG